MSFLLNPFGGDFYSELSPLQKRMLWEKWQKIENLIEKIDRFFKTSNWLEWVHVTDYKILPNTMVFTLYRWNIPAWKIEKIENEDILNGIDLSVNKYSLQKNIWNQIKITIARKDINETYMLKDYIESFKWDTIYLWLDESENIVKHEIDFSKANHYWIYGSTGFWKTNFTSSILYSLYMKNLNYEFTIIDPKWDLLHFDWIERVDYAHAQEDIIFTLRKLENKIKIIQKIYKHEGVRNYPKYKELKKENSYIKPRFILIEEFSILINSIEDSKLRDEVIKIVKSISLIWRSMWLSLLFSLQVPLKKIINDSELTRMLIPISFGIEDTMNQHIFWSKVDQNLEELKVWEWVIKQRWKSRKFKAFYLDKDTLDTFSEKAPKVSQTNKNKEEYYRYAQAVKRFSKKEAIELWFLNRQEFDGLSSELQAKWVLRKTSNNSLEFI